MRFEFTAGRVSLDFLATLAARGTAEVEKLRDPKDLAAWAHQSGMVNTPPRVSHADLELARAVREASAELIAAIIDDRPPRTPDRVLVNTAAAGPQPRLHLETDGLRRDGDVDAVLSVLARDCLDLHNSPDRALMRRCSDPSCSRIFVDRSRAKGRRWCGMKGCGDRAKAAAYRRRHR